jgi:hypothetical protein
MATNKRDLKAYSRFDGTGRIVPGSTVLRRNKPKVGNWKETQAYECCDGGGGNCCEPGTISIINFWPNDELFLPSTFGVDVQFVLTDLNCSGFNYSTTLSVSTGLIAGSVNTPEDIVNLVNASEIAQINGIVCRIGETPEGVRIIVDVDKCKCLGSHLTENTIVKVVAVNP